MGHFLSKLFSFFLVFERFSVEQDGFLLFPVGEKWFSSLMRIPLVILRHCKVDEILPICPFASLKTLLF